MSNRMYWYAVAASDDVAGLKNKGFCVTSDGEILYNEQYEYALARMYTSDGHGIVDVETSNFFFDKDANDRITINAEDPMTTPVLSYKLRMTDQYPDAEWFYFAADKSEEILEDGVPHPLYKVDGTLATKTDYADCEFDALNPMPSEFIGMYGRFTTATFSFATYQSTADVLHVEFTGLHQEEAEYCFADRLRVVVTEFPVYGIPMGGMMSPTGHSTYYVQELPEQIIVDNITLSGRMIPSSSLEEYFGNDQMEPESITINNDDVIIPLYDFDVPVTDQSKLYGVMRLEGTGTGRFPEEDDLSKPLMFKSAQDNSSIALSSKGTTSNTYQYSLDGDTWNQYTIDTAIPLNEDEYVFFKKLSGSDMPSTNSHFYFVMTGQIEAYNNINSMFFVSEWETADTLTTNYCGAYLFDGCASLTRAPALPATTLSKECYYRMFRGCTGLVKAPIISATTLATYCCEYMFEGCTSLVNAPALPATTLATYCYYYMFLNCTSLVNAPALPATTLATYCYGYMFKGCTSLVNAPALPATTLATYCYGYMFWNCTSLVNAPALPAMTLAENCYHDMFWNCTSLVNAPVLPATVLVSSCYTYMFEDCINLSEIHIYATDISASECLKNWLEDASSTGDIYCVNGVNYPTGVSGIPSGWTRHDI